MTTDRSSLVPEARTDKNGVTSVRWVNPDNKPALGAAPLPAPALKATASHEDEQQELYTEILAVLDQNPHRQNLGVNKNRLAALNRRSSDQTSLFRTILANVDSSETFGFIEQVHHILDHYGTEGIPTLINEESLESVLTIISSTEHIFSGDGSILPDEVLGMIHYALTSEDRELITNLILDRRPDTLAETEGLVLEARRSQPALRSGVL